MNIEVGGNPGTCVRIEVSDDDVEVFLTTPNLHHGKPDEAYYSFKDIVAEMDRLRERVSSLERATDTPIWGED